MHLAPPLISLLLGAYFPFGLKPSATVRFARGINHGAYGHLANRFRAILARDDIGVRSIETVGSLENIEN